MVTPWLVENEARAKQLNNFNGLQHGTCLATDIDGMIEYHNKAYVFFEVKCGNKQLPFGQKLALQRMVDDTGKAGKESIAIVVEHHIKDPSRQVPVAECKVRELYYFKEKKWRKPKVAITVKELIDDFFNGL